MGGRFARKRSPRTKRQQSPGSGLPLRVGGLVYIDDRRYIGHGVDDYWGGLSRVSSASLITIDDEPWVEFTVAEAPRCTVRQPLEGFAERQALLRRKFGRRRGYPLPDISPLCNDAFGPTSPDLLAEEGLIIVDGALATNPGEAALWHVRGECFLALGSPELAVAAFREALRLAPDRYSALVDLGSALLDLGQYDEARAVLERAASRAPEGDREPAVLLLICERRQADHSQKS